jgi:hypothetical protein
VGNDASLLQCNRIDVSLFVDGWMDGWMPVGY